MHGSQANTHLAYLCKPPHVDKGPAYVQMYCLAMGMTLHDLMECQVSEDSADTPEYFQTSQLGWDKHNMLLDVCDRAFPRPGPPVCSRPDMPGPGKEKAPGRNLRWNLRPE